jgi:hypothetical protein
VVAMRRALTMGRIMVSSKQLLAVQ